MKDGKDTIIVLPQFQIDGMVEIMNYILTHPGVNVGKIKKKFDLNDDEYRMIYDFCMPHIRHAVNERYWLIKFKGLYAAIEERIEWSKRNNKPFVTIKVLEQVLKHHAIGGKNDEAKDAFDSCDLEEVAEEIGEYKIES